MSDFKRLKNLGTTKNAFSRLFFYDILKILEFVLKQVSFNIPVLLSLQIRDIKTVSFEKRKKSQCQSLSCGILTVILSRNVCIFLIVLMQKYLLESVI